MTSCPWKLGAAVEGGEGGVCAAAKVAQTTSAPAIHADRLFYESPLWRKYGGSARVAGAADNPGRLCCGAKLTSIEALTSPLHL